MTSLAIPEYERRFLTPQQTYQILRANANFTSPKDFKITNNGQILFRTQVKSSTFSTKTTVSVHHETSSKGAAVSVAELVSKQPGFKLLLGEPGTATAIEVEEDLEASMLDRNFKFRTNGQYYAWQSTVRHSIRIPSEDGLGVAEETDGQDWKLIKLSSSKPMQDDDILATYIHEKTESSLRGNSGGGNLHWFTAVGEDIEIVSVTALMGMLHRLKQNAKEYSSGTSLLFS